MGTEVLLEDDVILISEENLEQDFEEREQAIFIREAVLAMKDPEREIFLRHYYYYQPITEISKEMGIHASTVKMKFHRGRKVLKEKLIKRGYIIGPENI